MYTLKTDRSSNVLCPPMRLGIFLTLTTTAQCLSRNCLFVFRADCRKLGRCDGGEVGLHSSFVTVPSCPGNHYRPFGWALWFGEVDEDEVGALLDSF